LKIGASVRPLAVVVADVLAKDSFERSMSQNEQPVKAFCTHGPHPAFRVGIGSRRSNRCFDHPDALGAKYLVETGRELRVTVSDEELDGSTSVQEITDQIASYLGNERTSRMVRDTQDVYLSSRKFDDEEHVELFE
jgi:hypothetical protein